MYNTDMNIGQKMARALSLGLAAAGCAAWFSGCSFPGGEETFCADSVEIVVAADASDATRIAARELESFLARAFGRRVPTVSAPTGAKKAIVLGVNAWSKAAGVDPTKLPRDSFVMKTVGNRLYIAGVDDRRKNPEQYNYLGAECLWEPQFERGTLFGVYEFLEKHAGVRMYFPGELGTIVPKAKSLPFPKEDRTSTPTYSVRRYGYADGTVPDEVLAGMTTDEFKRLNFYRLRGETQYIPCCHGQNKFYIPRRFGKEHPDYCTLYKTGRRSKPAEFNDRPHGLMDNQICQTSGAWEEMYRDIASYAKGEPASVRGIPDPEHPGKCAWGRNICGKYVDVMPNDGFQRCYCERCKKAFKPEGTSQFATDVIWGNVARLANRLTADGHDIHVTMMSYSPYQDVPAIDLPKNVDVMVATQGPWAKAMPERMKAHNDRIRAWKEKLGHKVWIWNYPDKVSCSGLLMPDVPQMSPHAWGEYYKSVKDLVIGAFAESESDRWFYNHLNYYVYGRVMWDAETDVDAVLDEYYRLMYGAGAAEVKELFETLEKIWVYDVAGKVNETPIGPKAAPPAEYQLWHDVYSEKTVKGFAALLDAAEAKVEKGSLEARRIALVRKEIVKPLAEHGAKYRASVGEARGIEVRRGRPDRSILEKGKFDFVELKTTNYVKFAQSLEGVLKPNTRYRISYFVKADHLTPMNHGAGVYCEFYDNDYRWFPKWSPICGTTDWVYQSFDTKTVEKFDGVKRPYFMFFVTGCTGTAYVKDVRMEEITD